MPHTELRTYPGALFLTTVCCTSIGPIIIYHIYKSQTIGKRTNFLTKQHVMVEHTLGLVSTYNIIIKAVYQGQCMALFQCIPRANTDNDSNLDHLQAELCGLTLANIYMERLNDLAKENAVKLPGMSF